MCYRLCLILVLWYSQDPVTSVRMKPTKTKRFGRGTCLGEHDGPYRRRRFLQVDVVWLYSSLKKTLFQIEKEPTHFRSTFFVCRRVNWSVAHIIHLYYGLGSWFLLKRGKVMFREAHCPVDTWTLMLDQEETADADAIVHHNRLAQTHRPRPQRQVWNLRLPYWRFSTECRDRLLSPTLCFRDWVF